MATLKISDLSVGDWVRWEVYDKTYDMLVSAVTDRRIYGLHDGIEYSMLLTQIYPIPITAEVLEKNGFVKKNYDNGKMWDWWCDNVLVRKYADEDIYRFIVALNSKHYTTTMVVGKHTHQLQHALSLAGVDKEINL